MKTLFAILVLAFVVTSQAAMTVTNVARQLAEFDTAGLNPLSQHGGSLNMHKAKWLHRAIETNRMVTIGTMGDSVGYFKLQSAAPWLWNTYGSNGAAFSGFINTMTFATNGAVTNKVVISDSTATNWFVDYFHVGAAGTVTWQGPVQDFYADTLRVFYIADTNLGSFKIQTSTNGGSFTDALTVSTASTTRRGAFTNVTVPIGWYRMRVVGVSGLSVIIGAEQWNSTASGVHLVSMCQGGNDWTHVSRVGTNVLTPIFGALNMSALLLEDKADAANHLQYAFPVLDTLRSQALTNCDVIWIGTTPLILNDTNTIGQNAADRAYCLTNDLPWFDGYTPVAPATNIYQLFGSWDGTHVPTACSDFIASRLLHELNLTADTSVNGARTPAFLSGYASTASANTFTAIQTVQSELWLKGSSGKVSFYDNTTTGLFDRHDLYRNNGKLLLKDTSVSAPMVEFSLGANVGYFNPQSNWRGLPFNLGTTSDPWTLTSTNTTLLGPVSLTNISQGVYINGYSTVVGELGVKGSGAGVLFYDRTTSGLFDRHDLYRDNGKLYLKDTSAGTPMLEFSLGLNTGFFNPQSNWRGFPFNLGTTSDPWTLTSTNTTLLGATNVVTFGGTNRAPVTTATPKFWISVQVSGLTNAFRLPIYE